MYYLFFSFLFLVYLLNIVVEKEVNMHVGSV